MVTKNSSVKTVELGFPINDRSCSFALLYENFALKHASDKYGDWRMITYPQKNFENFFSMQELLFYDRGKKC